MDDTTCSTYTHSQILTNCYQMCTDCWSTYECIIPQSGTDASTQFVKIWQCTYENTNAIMDMLAMQQNGTSNRTSCLSKLTIHCKRGKVVPLCMPGHLLHHLWAIIRKRKGLPPQFTWMGPTLGWLSESLKPML